MVPSKKKDDDYERGYKYTRLYLLFLRLLSILHIFEGDKLKCFAASLTLSNVRTIYPKQYDLRATQDIDLRAIRDKI